MYVCMYFIGLLGKHVDEYASLSLTSGYYCRNWKNRVPNVKWRDTDCDYTVKTKQTHPQRERERERERERDLTSLLIFLGDLYYKLNESSKVIEGYPRNISKWHLPDVNKPYTDAFSFGIRTFFIAGDSYYRYNDMSMVVRNPLNWS